MADFDIAYLTDAGRKRGNEPNQDSLLVLPAEADRRLMPLILVADGMGGHVGGAVASRMVVEAIVARYQQSPPGEDPLVLLGDCLQSAVEALRLHADQNPQLASMGSTVVLAILGDGRASVANIGDSRAYLIHEGNMTQVSLDHSVVAEQVRRNIISPQEAHSHPLRNRLTQSLSPRRAEIIPHIVQVPFTGDDTLVLCSDGLWGVIPEAMLQVVANELPPAEACRKLVQLAMDAGGPDNITVILARHTGERPTPPNGEGDDTSG